MVEPDLDLWWHDDVDLKFADVVLALAVHAPRSTQGWPVRETGRDPTDWSPGAASRLATWISHRLTVSGARFHVAVSR